jgi:hypothetical protein
MTTEKLDDQNLMILSFQSVLVYCDLWLLHANTQIMASWEMACEECTMLRIHQNVLTTSTVS